MIEGGRASDVRSVENVAAAFADIVTDTRRGRVLLGLVIACDEDPRIREAFTHFIAEVRKTLSALLSTLGMRNDPDSVAAFHAHAIGLVVLNLARNNQASREEAHRLMLALLRSSQVQRNDHIPR